MPDHALFKRRVEDVLDEFLLEEIRLLEETNPRLAPLGFQAHVASSAGKRLRSAFCYWGWRACGQPDCEEVVRAAAAMELVHAAAIVHDDIIDSSMTRHGAPTAHVALQELLDGAEQRHTGGVALAILVGDLLMTLACQLFASCGLPGSYLARARPLWETLAKELIAGEFMEILSTGRHTAVSQSLEIIRFKTAKYTIERPLHIGGALAGASADTMRVFTDYGLPLGEAFQLRDDLLGVFGDPETSGKSNADDLKGRKPTVLLAMTRSLAEPAELTTLDRLMSGEPTPSAIERIREIMRTAGSREHVETMIDERVRTALSVIDRSRLPPGSRNALKELALTATVREE
ncbi:polyprenyl synthetase family protein [Sphaerisporangium sp. NBC_01403]|uniref:polyprenyl synthetase family protein n=1 Tax=Sphaerisporangium sp. NBC_01403 TaxID=2903599 RepID=UPI00325112F4